MSKQQEVKGEVKEEISLTEIPRISKININTNEHVIDIDKITPITPKTKNSIDNEWNVGCFKLDRRCIVYFSQMTILATVIGVSLYQVSTTSENQTFWVGLLSASIGIIAPQPKLKNKDKSKI